MQIIKIFMISQLSKHSHSYLFSKINVVVNGKTYMGDEGDTVRQFLMKNQMPVCSNSCKSCKVLVDNIPILPCTTYLKPEMHITTKPKTDKPEILRTMKMVADAPNFF